MPVQLLEPLLAGAFQHLVQGRVPAVQIHVDIMPEPYPAAPFLGGLPAGACKNMVFVKLHLRAADKASLFVTLKD